MAAIRIEPLANHPGHVDACLNWWLDEWGFGMGFTPQSGREAIKDLITGEGGQTALIGFVGGAPAGSVFLVREDLETHRHLTPWLAALYVLPEYRKLGLGGQLITALVSHARDQGNSRLYLYTKIGDYYRRSGWTTAETLEVNGKPHEIMQYALGPGQTEREA